MMKYINSDCKEKFKSDAEKYLQVKELELHRKDMEKNYCNTLDYAKLNKGNEK